MRASCQFAPWTNEGAQVKENTKTVIVTLPAGTKLHPSSRPKCVYSQLAKDGPTACPEGSKVGQGTATADARPTVPDPVNATVTLYNGIDDFDAAGNPISPGVPSLLFYAHTEIGVNSSLPFDIKKNTLELDFAPPSDGQTQLFHIQKVDITIPKAAKPYVTAPVKCAKKWLTTMAIANYDGPTVRATDKQKCTKA